MQNTQKTKEKYLRKKTWERDKKEDSALNFQDKEKEILVHIISIFIFWWGTPKPHPLRNIYWSLYKVVFDYTALMCFSSILWMSLIIIMYFIEIYASEGFDPYEFKFK